MSADLYSTSPYRGLDHFSEADAPFFFGRERMSEIVSTSLLASRLTVVYGPSGAGKSSLLSAGVVHRLRRRARQNVNRTGEPGLAIAMLKNWSGNLQEALMTESRDALARALDDPDLSLTGGSSSLVDSLRERTTNAGLDLLLVFDQFEEFFINCSNEQEREEFGGEFARLIISPGLRVNALISIRDDCFTRLELLKDKGIFNLFDYSIEISRLTREEARAAIEEPIRQYNRFFAAHDRRIEIEPELIEAVLDEVRAGKNLLGEDRGDRYPVNRSAADDPPIEAPYLQLVMGRLWEEMGSEASCLRLETFRKLGGAPSIARDHLLSVLNGLEENERSAAAILFRHMVTASGTKIAYPVYDLVGTDGIDRQALDTTLSALSGKKRILRPLDVKGARGVPLYEIFHDVLADAVLEWSGKRALDEQKQRTEEERARADREKRIARRMTLLAVAATVLLALAIILGLAAYRNRVIAERNREKAEENWRKAVDEHDRFKGERNLLLMIDHGGKQAAFKVYPLIWLAGLESDQAKKAEFSKEIDNKISQEKDVATRGVLSYYLGAMYYLLGEYASGSQQYKAAGENYELARGHYRASLETLRETLRSRDGADSDVSRHPYLANVLNDLGAAGYALGEFSDVEKHLTEAVRIWRETDGRRFIAPAIQNLATIYSLKGEFDKAEQLYNETLDILRESEVAGDLQRARAIRGLAEVHFYRAGSDKGQLEQAERLFQEALELAARQAGSESADTLQFLASLSRLYSKQGRQAEARSLMEKALVIKLNDSAPGKGEVSPPAPGDVYLHLGIVFSGAGEYDDAKLFFELAISRLQGSRGTDELNLSLSYSGLAFVYEKQRRLPEAETLYKQALEIQKKYHLEEAPFSVETREGYAELLRKMGR